MAAVRLIEMTAADFARWKPKMDRHYAQSLAANKGVPLAEAERRAAEGTAKMLADGPETVGQLLWTAFAGDAEVGSVWASMPGYAMPAEAWLDEILVEQAHLCALNEPEQPGTAWIHRLDIDPELRSRGFGTAAIAAVESEAATAGASKLGGAITPARSRWAERLGFAVIAQQMSKKLP